MSCHKRTINSILSESECNCSFDLGPMFGMATSFSKETGGMTYSFLHNNYRFGTSTLRRRPC